MQSCFSAVTELYSRRRMQNTHLELIFDAWFLFEESPVLHTKLEGNNLSPTLKFYLSGTLTMLLILYWREREEGRRREKERELIGSKLFSSSLGSTIRIWLLGPNVLFTYLEFRDMESFTLPPLHYLLYFQKQYTGLVTLCDCCSVRHALFCFVLRHNLTL